MIMHCLWPFNVDENDESEVNGGCTFIASGIPLM